MVFRSLPRVNTRESPLAPTIFRCISRSSALSLGFLRESPQALRVFRGCQVSRGYPPWHSWSSAVVRQSHGFAVSHGLPRLPMGILTGTHGFCGNLHGHPPCSMVSRGNPHGHPRCPWEFPRVLAGKAGTHRNPRQSFKIFIVFRGSMRESTRAPTGILTDTHGFRENPHGNLQESPLAHTVFCGSGHRGCP